jgi:hypothetical protein
MNYEAALLFAVSIVLLGGTAFSVLVVVLLEYIRSDDDTSG